MVLCTDVLKTRRTSRSGAVFPDHALVHQLFQLALDSGKAYRFAPGSEIIANVRSREVDARIVFQVFDQNGMLTGVVSAFF